VPRLYADENIPRPLVQRLRDLGHDVQMARDVGLAGRGVPDTQHLEHATLQARTLLTHDWLDFVRLHQSTHGHAGIVAMTYDPDLDRLAANTHAALVAVADAVDHLVRVTRGGFRVVERR
jgi:predicted nuclease of predicted toxin-antitoxin system